MARSVNNRQHVIDHGEVFTPPGLVNDMLDLVAHECERIDSRFLERACGDGNFLAEVLRRKLATVDKQGARNRPRWERDAVPGEPQRRSSLRCRMPRQRSHGLHHSNAWPRRHYRVV